MRERRLFGSERGRVAIVDDDHDHGTAGDAGTANGVDVVGKSALSTRPQPRPKTAGVSLRAGRIGRPTPLGCRRWFTFNHSRFWLLMIRN
jgi:hypothetical protein